MDLDALGETFVTLAVIMDPIGLAPIFVAMTRGQTSAQRRRAAVKAVLAAGALVIGFALFGGLLLEYLHVSVESLSIAGGLLLLLVALEMLRGEDYPEASEQDVSLVPLATPLVAGPGAIATVIVLSRTYDDAGGRLGVITAIVGALLVVGATLFAAEALSRRLPDSFIDFLTRVLGLLLSAIAVQLVVDGVRGTLAAG
ncbi:MarC family protein [Conexibacter sp. SYSU D00693]|uniref:MarC family protein n=1 Tax=Conexibacter sp. SYSU D00693 TaxID=2812560 RepID=UPI00196AFD2F|nr:MarC family protein [Conexibacter sp. SYSU D00693]